MHHRPHFVSLAGSAALAGAAFLPWLRLGDVGLTGLPDPAGFFVLGLGILGVVLSAIGLRPGRDTRPWLVLVGLAGATTLVLVWMTGPGTVAERAQARAEAVALVDNVAVEPPPPVRIGAGVLVGLAGAALVVAAGMTATRRK